MFPFIQDMGGADSTFAAPMKDARLTIPSPGSLAKVIDMLDEVPIDDLDTKGDVYEYLLSEISTSGKNGQFRTPRHIIQLIVEMIAPEPGDTIVDPASGTCGFLVAGVEYMRSRHADEMAGGAWRSHFTTRCSPISASTAPCCGSGR